MPGRLAVDFGTSNTVIAAWDEIRQEGLPLFIPEYGRTIEQENGEPVSLVPSLIHYAGSRRWVGEQVIHQDLYTKNGTFRWMKRYILGRSPMRLRVGERMVSPADAGRDFLTSVLLYSTQELGMSGEEEVAFTVPVESYEHYENWLGGVSEAAGMPRYRLIDEPSAAALGYGAHIQPGDVYLIFDFGGGTLDVSVVLIEKEEHSRSGRRCRVLGKAGADLGGATIDQWLFQQVLRQNGRSDGDDSVRPASSALLVACERAKEKLSVQTQVEVNVETSAGILQASIDQEQFEMLLEDHEVFSRIDRTIRRALNASFERGYTEEHLKSVLMIGGSSQIPAVQRTVRRIFGRERVLLSRPLDAVARGAAAFIAGVDFYDHIQHDYAIRYVNPETGTYDYLTLVSRGAPYPSTEPVARLRVKATRDGQDRLGIAIFERGERYAHDSPGRYELVFDPSGAARIHSLSPDEEEQRSLFWMNETKPTFLEADPPGKMGEARFEVEFSLDANKRLLITARDLMTGRLAYRDQPVIQLI